MGGGEGRWCGCVDVGVWVGGWRCGCGLVCGFVGAQGVRVRVGACGCVWACVRVACQGWSAVG